MSPVLPDSLAELPSFVPRPNDFSVERIETSKLRNRLSHVESGLSPDVAKGLVERAELLFRTGQTLVAREEIELAVLMAAKQGDSEALHDGLLLQTKICLLVGNIVGAEEAVARLDGVTYGSREPHVQARYSEAKGWLLLRTGDLTNRMFYEAESRFRTALRADLHSKDRRPQLRCLEGLASCLAANGQYPAAIGEIDRALQIASREEMLCMLPRLLLARSFALRDLGFHPAADVHFRLTLAWAELLGDVVVLSRALMGYAVLKGYFVTLTSIGGLGEVESMFGRASELAHSSSAIPLLGEIAFWLSSLYDKLEMPEKSAETMNELRRTGFPEGDEEGLRLFINRRIEKRELDARRESRLRAKTRETIESIPDALFIFDPVRDSGGHITELFNEFRNSAADRVAGCTTTDVRTLTELSALDEFKGLVPAIYRSVRERAAFSDEVPLGPESASWIVRTVVPVGEGAAVTFRDITTHVAAEIALREAAAQAREADRAKSEFLANMSHEIRTPINGVLGLARLLSETELTPLQKRYVEGISSSGDILLGVLGDVLDLSKIEARRVELHPEPTNIRMLVTDLVELFSGQASQKGLTFDLQISEEVPETLLIDASRLRQVVANLVGKALKFTQSGGVRVSVTGSHSLRIAVSDTGPGVDAAEFESIFQAFRQGATGAQYGGTGLGLTISRRIVELMGGKIGMRSQLGEGTEFWFEIPVEAANPSAVDSDLPPSLEGMRVLLVEDNEVNVLVATGLLEQLGCVVEVATDGESAVELAIGGGFDVILMDVRIPGIDGLEATRRIRAAQSPERRVRIVALTASALTDDRRECFEAGMDAYLGKPITYAALRNALARGSSPEIG